MPHQWRFRRLLYIFLLSPSLNFYWHQSKRQCSQVLTLFRLELGRGDSEYRLPSRLLQSHCRTRLLAQPHNIMYSRSFPLALVLIPVQSLTMSTCIYVLSPNPISIADARHYHPLRINASQAIRVLTSLRCHTPFSIMMKEDFSS